MTNLIHRKVTICMIFIGLTLLGYISYKQLPVELLPNAELPMLFVQIGAITQVSPQYMEQQGVIPVEGAIGTLEGVEKIDTRINGNQAFIQVSFEQDVRFKYVYLKLQQKIDAVKRQLPEDLLVNVSKIDLQQLTNQFLELQIRGSGGTDRLRNLSEQEIRPAFENLNGIASINIFGGRQKNLEILLDKQACEPHNITPESVRSRLTQNSGSRALAGFVYEGDYRYFIRTASEYAEVKDIENIVMAPGPILLKDVARISFGVDEETSISRVNGKDAISLTITKASQANIIELSHECLALIDQLNEKLKAQDVEIVVQRNLADRMESNIQQIINLGLIGGLLAVFVLWIFLKDLRLISIIAVSIPISVFTAFNLFYGAGISINSLTLVGMALAVGMLLDNSIVVLENIYRLVAGGTTAEKAVTQGASGVVKAILAATLTTATVFLPFLFFGNYLIALIGKHIGVSIISTLVVSLLVALLLIPVLAYMVLGLYSGKRKVSFGQSKVRTPAERLYLVLLKSSLRRPARTIIGGLLLFFITTFAVLAVSISTSEEVESDQIDVFITMAKGATIEKTDKVVREIEAKLEGIAEKKDINSRVQEEDAVVSLVLQEDFETIEDRSFYEIQEQIGRLSKQVGGATISLSQQSSEGGGGGGIGGMDALGQLMGFGNNQQKIVLKGEDYPLLQRVAQDFSYYIENLEGTRNTSLSIRGSRPEVQLVFDPLTLARNEITPQNIALALRDFGQESPADTKFQYADEEYNIIIRESEREETEFKPKTMADLRKLEVNDRNGGQHEMASFTNIRTGEGNDEVRRINQQKQIEVNYSRSRLVDQTKDLLEAHQASVQSLIANYPLPPGIAVEMVEAEDQFKDFKALAGAALLLIFIILASVFESLSAPFVLLFSVPMAVTGALLALFITGNSLFNANTLTGFLILLGVIVNNGIIMIDYVNALRRQGYRKTRALMTAGLHRLRPILITAITTIVAMFPLALGTAEYVSLIGAPFAITVIGGLALGTLLTLVVIPTVYLGLENTISWFRDLPWWVKALNIAIIAGGSILVYFRVSSLLWQMADILLLLFLVPGITYFIRTSLRRAKAELIPPGETLHIKVQNLVKIYGRPGRFAREWSGSQALADYHRSIQGRRRWGLLFREFIWQIPLLVFLSWYTFRYLDGGFWTAVLGLGIYFLLLEMWKPLATALAGSDSTWRNRIRRIIGGIIFWITPLILLVQLNDDWNGPGYAIVLGTLWYLSMIIYRSSSYMHRKQLKIERLKGRIRRFYYRLISSIPVLGKRTIPFKALNGVSLEIGTGMYGLLGPNGAGKSTLMRIISGIFDQSYGKIWINGIDTQQQREELQGLIGYLPQAFGSYENMSAWNYLDYQAILKGLYDHEVRKERLEYVLGAVNMLDRKDEKIGSFSGGMKQRIGIAQILLHLPRILVVDEPTAGLDPRERIRFRNLLVQLSRERIVIFSTHIIEDIASSCNQLAVIDKGSVKYQGSPQDMLQLAEGLVWEYVIPARELSQTEKEQVVVNHLREGDKIRVRCIARSQPMETAVPAEPVLEDAYLCLLKNIVR